MTHPDPIKALEPCPFCGGEATVNTGSDFAKSHYFVMCKVCHGNSALSLSENEVRSLWNRRANLKPMANGRTGVLLNDIRAIADTGGRRIETAMDACDKIIELIDMERQLGPAAPAPSRFEIDGTSQDFHDCEGSDAPTLSDEGRMERIVKAFERVLLDIDFAIEQGILPDIMNDMIYVEARAALAAIKGVE